MSLADVSPKALLAKLVGFDTTSSKSNLPLIAFVEQYLAEHGVASERLPAPDQPKASLFATIGPAGRGGIGLSGHTDVVPTEGQAWSSDPYTLTERDGRLYGRGTCDMKGFLACVLAAVPHFKARDLTIPLHLLFSYDEEIGCLGVRPMIGKLGRSLAEPETIVVGEPTSMGVVDAHKGIHAFVTEVRGHAAHTSMPHLGVNAIAVAGRIVTEIDRLAAKLRDRRDGERFTPPYTTVSVGKIAGGTALNIVPRDCRVTWHLRSVPGTDPEEVPRRLAEFVERELRPAMAEIAPQTGVETRRLGGIPGFSAAPGSPAVSLALRLSRQNDVQAVSYGTEAGLFEEAGRPTVVCGPGDIAQAHTADEFIEEAQLAECMAFLERLADHASGG